MHAANGHGQGVRSDLASIQAKFLHEGARESAKRVVVKCVECQKMTKQPRSQQMAPLPDRQFSNLQPFSQTTMDLAGPFVVKVQRLRVKVYALVVVCAQVRAVHFEKLWDLSSSALLNAIAKITLELGPIVQNYSDNGGNFVKAAKLLIPEDDPDESTDLIRKSQAIDWEKLRQEAKTRGIQAWEFSSPKNPSENGLSESMVKAMKRAMHTTMRRSLPTMEQFETMLAYAKNKVNSRPLSYVPNDHWEAIEVLTPNHFLVKRMGSETRPMAEQRIAEDPQMRWTQTVKLMEEVGRRFIAEVMPSFHGRPKWQEAVGELKVGQVVLIAEDALHRWDWPLARVAKILDSKDALDRRVELETKPNDEKKPRRLIRNVRQIVPLDGLE